MTYNRFQTCETPALPERTAAFHRAEQRIVETLHRIAPARKRGVCSIDEHSDAEPSPESRGFPRCGFRDDRLIRDPIEDCQEQVRYHGPPPITSGYLL
jgi:hypothetical protein